ncbi:bifunctional DNA-binding transcriptional regulator/O6-methylguanine-DNA methyltransferase Ada [Iodobacter sp. CM08]|uniref:bifunctional DNA-binding transcriptional regulator/O6-methylguanine-DNA methyltransferase Ada n=1 Tax=Iodobacter sp. CM08 TaxID=3085902 RepID=UPI002982A2D4|nr:bifunctional DNA-binding transcriptional regulator/O6-methylguanine-DNA methyltransferase Ada [Iodobacter sp. CM08]MDW5418361.1 bifunctional DNA-binding transcriptional regulator/O6-methylguanine-DNA methyltransferase Ada [Iodobacter sp. CM08]
MSKQKQAAETLSDPRWAQLIARDAQADGRFYYAVLTTGVYCRPSCGARLPRPENVRFFSSGQDAEQAGFRACLRCKPDQAKAAPHTQLIAQVCRQIEIADTPPSLAQLAQFAQLSPSYLQRIFKAETGVSPKAYAAAHRGQKVRAHLASSASVTEAIYAAGYNSNGRFYEDANQLLGMTPKNFRAGGSNTQIRFAVGECSLGAILVAASQHGVCAILMGDDPQALLLDLQARFLQAELIGGDADFERLVAQVVGFVEMPQRGLDLPLDVRGTAFQQRVWQALQDIPAGATASYSDIAQRIGAPKSARAVAGACAANALAVAIPCHRVVRNDGGLSGYRWGIERKRALLEREAGVIRSDG